MSKMWKRNENRLFIYKQRRSIQFANEVPGVFENAKKSEGFVEITPLKASHRTNIAANCCDECRMVAFEY